MKKQSAGRACRSIRAASERVDELERLIAIRR